MNNENKIPYEGEIYTGTLRNNIPSAYDITKRTIFSHANAYPIRCIKDIDNTPSGTFIGASNNSTDSNVMLSINRGNVTNSA